MVLVAALDTLIAGTPYDVRAPGGRVIGTGGLLLAAAAGDAVTAVRAAGTGGGCDVGGARVSSGTSPHDDTATGDVGASAPASDSLRDGSCDTQNHDEHDSIKQHNSSEYLPSR